MHRNTNTAWRRRPPLDILECVKIEVELLHLPHGYKFDSRSTANHPYACILNFAFGPCAVVAGVRVGATGEWIPRQGEKERKKSNRFCTWTVKGTSEPVKRRAQDVYQPNTRERHRTDRYSLTGRLCWSIIVLPFATCRWERGTRFRNASVCRGGHPFVTRVETRNGDP